LTTAAAAAALIAVTTSTRRMVRPSKRWLADFKAVQVT
jgi:hypothetical protein